MSHMKKITALFRVMVILSFVSFGLNPNLFGASTEVTTDDGSVLAGDAKTPRIADPRLKECKASCETARKDCVDGCDCPPNNSDPTACKSNCGAFSKICNEGCVRTYPPIEAPSTTPSSGGVTAE